MLCRIGVMVSHLIANQAIRNGVQVQVLLLPPLNRMYRNGNEAAKRRYCWSMSCGSWFKSNSSDQSADRRLIVSILSWRRYINRNEPITIISPSSIVYIFFSKSNFGHCWRTTTVHFKIISVVKENMMEGTCLGKNTSNSDTNWVIVYLN